MQVLSECVWMVILSLFYQNHFAFKRDVIQMVVRLLLLIPTLKAFAVLVELHATKGTAVEVVLGAVLLRCLVGTTLEGEFRDR